MFCLFSNETSLRTFIYQEQCFQIFLLFFAVKQRRSPIQAGTNKYGILIQVVIY